MSFHHSPRIKTDGLVFYVDAKNSKSYPGSGSSWYDLSGNNYNVTLYNSPVYSDGTLQFRSASPNYGAVSFDEGVLMQSNELGSWTIEVLFKHQGTPSGGESFIAGRIGCHGGIYVTTSNNLTHAVKTTEANCWTGAAIPIVQASMSVGSWYHSIMSYEDGYIKSYVNGVKVLTTTFDRTTYNMTNYSASNFRIGGTAGHYSNSDIAFVRCYNTALTDSDALKNYTAARGRMI